MTDRLRAAGECVWRPCRARASLWDVRPPGPASWRVPARRQRALRQPHTLLVRQGSQNADNGVFEDAGAVQVLLGEALEGNTIRGQPLQML